MEHNTRLGPVAVFLTIVAMVITTLALLTVATSNADRVMAGRFANITQTRYELEAEGEKFIASVAAGQAAGMEGAAASDDGYSFTAEKDGYRLEVEAAAPDAGGNVEIKKWKLSRIWNSSDPLNDIWQGF